MFTRMLTRIGFFFAIWMGSAVVAAFLGDPLAGIVVLAGFVGGIIGAAKLKLEGQDRSSGSSSSTPELRVTLRVSPPSSGGSRHISVGDEVYTLPQSKGQAPARLVPETEFVEVHGFKIKGPVYVGSLRERYADSDPSVIEPRLKVARGAVEDMGYWPAYGRLSPAQRHAYLTWLSGERDNVSNLGFVYLYYYGFERYVLRDAANDPAPVRNQNLRTIASEVRRLRGLIGEQNNFDNYANNLLDAIAVLHRPDALDQRKAALPPRQSLAVQMAIARYANEFPDQVVDPDWALAWLIAFGSISRTRNLREQYPVLRALFKATYLAKGGLKAPSCKTKLRMSCSTASRGLDDVADLPVPANWCDPTQLKRPLSQLQNIYDEVMPGVRSFWRAREKGDRVAMLAAWPNGISTEHQPQIHQFVQSIQKVLDSDASTVGGLSQLFWAEVPAKLTATQAKQLASAVATAGRIMVPHPQLTKVGLTSSDRLLSYPGIPPEELSPEGERVSLSIQLGAILALSDGEVHDNERLVLQKLVQAHPNAKEREYLSRLVEWRLLCPPSTNGLKAQVDLLSGPQKEDMARHLVAIARADGSLPASEISQLEKLFKRLGLESTAVTQMLHSSASTGAVPSKPASKADSGSRSEFELDHAAIAAHAAATKEIHGVLGRIFSEEGSEEASAAEELHAAPVTDSAADDTSWHQGLLDAEHAELADWLLTGDSWTMDEVIAKCREIGLMPDGALEKINEAAFDTVGDALLELGDTVDVYRDMLAA